MLHISVDGGVTKENILQTLADAAENAPSTFKLPEAWRGPVGPSGPVGEIPAGAIVAFSEKCPQNWTLFDEALGRVLVGATPEGVLVTNVDQNGKALTPRALNEAAGEETHVLDFREIPPHQHAFSVLEYRGNLPIPVFGPSTQVSPDANLSAATEKATAIDGGGGEPHNNMPPFVSIFYCTNID